MVPYHFNVLKFKLLADPGEARGCSINSLVINWLIDSFSQPFSPTALRRHLAQTVRDRCSNYKIDYVVVIKNFPEGHQNPISGSKVTAILLKGGFCLLVELQWGKVCVCSLRSRLVLLDHLGIFSQLFCALKMRWFSHSKIGRKRMTEFISQLIAKVFVEQPRLHRVCFIW